MRASELIHGLQVMISELGDWPVKDDVGDMFTRIDLDDNDPNAKFYRISTGETL